jgi:WD repeat and SOF domain-containing protein 1
MSFVARQGMVHRERSHHKPNILPTHSNSANVGAQHRRSSESFMPWTDPVSSFVLRRLRVPLSDPRHVNPLDTRHGGRKKSKLFQCLCIFSIGCIIFAFVKFIRSKDKRTLVFGRENLQQIWKWEIESGHNPSYRKSM